jgi:segregation and condensation protein B
MEDIRGVTINSLLIKQLEDRGWVEVIGHREAVGRPALFATTKQFLDDLGLTSLDQLPAISHPGSQGADALDPFMEAMAPSIEDSGHSVPEAPSEDPEEAQLSMDLPISPPISPPESFGNE